ncbi:hypothetical protein SRB5_69260 [Streptomyces sp. RB5]|uniref:Lipoprotein n=1 Tax=Streptomyces smaragdinus TaxID=2585196 RepID=A0A7K0CVN6_9ACTN|nr:hypothetical protein [Streptomyces smaragdinus]MQY16724.1 hypothetical protein [Streptomyces smaragdinus]
MRQAAVAAVACAVVAALGSGCSLLPGDEDPDKGTNGVGKLPADQIEAKTLAAARKASSVRLSGSVVSGGKVFTLDMRLTNDGGTGEVSTKGSTFSVLRVDKDLYLKADDNFWLEKGSAGKEPTDGDVEAAQKLDGMFVKVPEDDASYKQLYGFTDRKVLLDGLIELHGDVETGDRTEVDGVRTIGIVVDGGDGGSLAVSLEGTPYPLRVERAGGAGVLELGSWGEEFEVKAPRKEEVVDYGDEVAGD